MKMGQPKLTKEPREKAMAQTGPRQSMVARLVSSIRRLSHRARCRNCLRTTSNHCQIKETRDQATQVDLPSKTTTGTQCETKTAQCGTQWCKQAANTISTQTKLLWTEVIHTKELLELPVESNPPTKTPSSMASAKISGEAESDLSDDTTPDEKLPQSAQLKSTPWLTIYKANVDVSHNGTKLRTTHISRETETRSDHPSSSSLPPNAEVVKSSMDMEQEVFSAMGDEDDTLDITSGMEDAVKDLDKNIEQDLSNASNTDVVPDNTIRPTHDTVATGHHQTDIEKEILSAMEDEDESPNNAHVLPNDTQEYTHNTHAGHPPPDSSDGAIESKVDIEEAVVNAIQNETADVTLLILDAMEDLDVSVEQDLPNADIEVEGTAEPRSYQMSEESIPLPGTFKLKRSISSPGFHHIERDPPNKELFLAEARLSTISLHKLDIGMHNFDPYPEFSLGHHSFSSCRSSTTAHPSGTTVRPTKGQVAAHNSAHELSIGTRQTPVTIIAEAIRALEDIAGECHGDMEKELDDAMQEDSAETQVPATLAGSVGRTSPKSGDTSESPAKTMESGELTEDDCSDDITLDMEEAMMELDNTEEPGISGFPDTPNTSYSFCGQTDIPVPGTLSLTRSISSPGFYHIERDPPNTQLFWAEMRRGTRSLYKLDLRDYNFDPEEELPFLKKPLKIWSLDTRRLTAQNSPQELCYSTLGQRNARVHFVLEGKMEQNEICNIQNVKPDNVCDSFLHHGTKQSLTYPADSMPKEEIPGLDRGEARRNSCNLTPRYDEPDQQNKFPQPIAEAMHNFDHANENWIIEIEDAMADFRDGSINSIGTCSMEACSAQTSNAESPSNEVDIPLSGIFTLTHSISAPASSHLNRDPPNAMPNVDGLTRSLYRLHSCEYNFDPYELFPFQKSGLLSPPEANSISSSPYSIIQAVTSSFSGQVHTAGSVYDGQSKETICRFIDEAAAASAENWMIISACSLESFCQIDKVDHAVSEPTGGCSQHTAQSSKAEQTSNDPQKHRLDHRNKCLTQSITPVDVGNESCIGTPQPLYYVDAQGFKTPKVEVSVLIDDDIVWELEPDGTRRLLGTGSFGTVEAARLKTEDGQTVPVAVKRYRSEIYQDAFIREGKMQQYLGSTGVFPKFYGYLDICEGDKSIICLVSELFGRGTTLWDIIHEASVLTHKEWMSVCVQLAKGLRKIHSRDVIFNDVKSNNILVDMSTPGTPLVKYIDPGVASFRSGIKYKYTAEELRSVQHIAPEVKTHHQCTSALSDIWGLGVLYAEIASKTGLPGLDHVARAAMVTEPDERISLEGITETLVLIGRSQNLF